ncbi:MAG: hypothetical protein C5B48_14970 [Candidatus Rokuibacteriota bacterium]|nr:MAG: hypothetical protein C5B48_14970 [Candidatus Rokubacteria bacterium]
MADLVHAQPGLRERALTLPRRRTKQTSRAVTFPELVHFHRAWRQALDGEEGRLRQAEESYRSALGAFERRHGKIVNSYWCTSVESAVALTLRPRSRLMRLLGVPDTIRFHRVSDWATKDKPEIAEALHECDALAIKASEVLVGKARPIALQLVMASAGHLLSLVDERSAHSSSALTKRAVAGERKELGHTASYLRKAANGEAQIVYVFGMTLGVAGLALLTALVALFADPGRIDRREFFGCLIAGGLGALVSVMSRISAGRFALASDFGARYPLFLGILRPLIGSIFGLVIYFALASGVVKIFNLPEQGSGLQAANASLYFYAAMAFLAGFSERWARDMLLGSKGLGRDEAEAGTQPSPAQPQRARRPTSSGR